MKDLDSIVADNSAVPRQPKTISPNRDVIVLKALKTAKASLKDVLKHGPGFRQMQTIDHIDLPLVEAAIKALEAEMGS